MDFKQVIIARKDAPFMSGIGVLKGKRVAVVKGVRLHEKLLSPYPDIQVVQENSMEDMFKAVSDSRADALFSRTYYAAYTLHKYPDLKIAGVLDLPPEPYLYAVRKDYPELVNILNKAIAAIPRDEYEAIVQKWFSVHLEYRPNWYEILKWASAVVGVLLVILVLTLFWNRRMAGEIEKRKETERTLRETEEELRAEKEFIDKLLDAPADTVFVFDPSTGKAIRWNKVFSLVSGYSDEEIASQKAPDAYYSETDLQGARTAIAKMLKEGKGTIELTLTTKDGKLIPFEYSGSLVADRDGVPRLLISIGRDITERRRAEEERLQLERQLQEARKAESLGRMAAAIAHHLNNLLGVVTGNLELAMLDLPQGSKPRSNITDAMAASWRAADVGRSMLAYLGQSVGTRAPIGLAEICREALPTLTASLPEKVRLKIEFPNNGPIIHADAVQIRQILTNLVVNAGESIGAGEGEVVVAVYVMPAADIRASKFYPPDWEPQHDSYACLEVSDTGAGMDQETLERVFEPFFSTKFTGRGLGLAVVLGSVKAHEGVVIVESTLGRGSVFRVFLPVVGQEMEPPGKQEPAERVTAGDRGLVLLVDDEPALRRMAQTMLKRLDYEVITAADGVDALEVFREKQDRVRCVLLDLTMPRMDGWETLAELRALRPGLPVVLASGYNKTQVMKDYHAELPQAFLHKPYDMKELESALDTAMRTSIDANKG
jgi:PAS domain S-box-containing protein